MTDRHRPHTDWFDRAQDEGEPRARYQEFEPDDSWSYTEIWLIPGPFNNVGPRGYTRSDQRLYEDVCERLMEHGQIDASDMEVKVENGEVTLSGSVNSREARRLAEDLAASVFGAKDVHNRVKVNGGQSRPGWGNAGPQTEPAAVPVTERGTSAGSPSAAGQTRPGKK